VPAASAITSVAGLRGQKVAFTKGSNAHYLLVKALEKAGLKYSDINTVTLAPADARAAFERGSVDAWSIWDPFLAAAEKQLKARVLANGTGIVSNHQFYLAARSYAQKNPQILQILTEELAKVDEWGGRNHAEVAALLGPLTGLEPAVTELAARRLPYGVKPVTREVIAEQQRIADTFAPLKLIPKKIDVSRALLANIS
ncbi:MAG: ABC transporter substrate-binding protein, partial [Janthinobacterium lividum]